MATMVTIVSFALITRPAVDRRGAPRGSADSLYDPIAAGEDPPPGYRALLPRDAIAPVYEPSFVPGRSIDWSDETLVLGVSIAGDARAYPISFLNFREMVIDEVGGSPILVSW